MVMFMTKEYFCVKRKLFYLILIVVFVNPILVGGHRMEARKLRSDFGICHQTAMNLGRINSNRSWG